MRPFLISSQTEDFSAGSRGPGRVLALFTASCLGLLHPGLLQADSTDVQPLAFLSHGGETNSRLEVLWPIIERRQTKDFKESFFRPLFHHLLAGNKEREAIHVIYPIGLYRRNGPKVTGWIFPVFFYARRPQANGSITTDYTLFPVFFRGQHRRGKKYTALLPFGGTLRDLFLKDKIELYTLLYIRAEKGDLKTNHLFGPLIGWSEGTIKGGRFWPLYARYTKKGKWKRSWMLWPLIHAYASHPASGDDRQGFVFVPVYARKHDGPSDQWSVLFPFFGYARNKESGARKWTVPWPFIEITSGPTRGVRVWPFYGRRQRQTGTRSFLLWPFYHHLHRKDEAYEESATWLVPIFWSHSKTETATSGKRSRWRLWPLARFERNVDASSRFAILALLPFRDPPGFDKIVAPFWELYVKKKGPDGTLESYAFWRLYAHRKSADGFFWQLAPFFSYGKSSADEKEWKALFGLVQRRQTKGASRWKFFHLWKFELPRRARSDRQSRVKQNKPIRGHQQGA